MKPGYKTTEFWIVLLTGLITAVVGVLVANGLMSTATSDAVVQIMGLLVVALVPVVLGWISTRYTHGRTAVKLEEIRHTTIYPAASHNDIGDGVTVDSRE